MIIVPDTSVVIDGRITSLIKSGEYRGATIVIPEPVLAELEAQANQGREIGFSGLTEIQELWKMAQEGLVQLKFAGERPKLEQVKLASGGEIDALIRKVAIEFNAKFVTSDVVQAEVAKAKGLDVLYIRPQMGDFSPLGIDQFFDEETHAVFLKERVPPMARRGDIRETRLVTVREAPMTEYELRAIAQEILERAKRDPDGFIEVEKRGITVVQIGSMRISIARRPFSDGMEITAIRPVARIPFENYRKSDVLKKEVTGAKRGVLISGAPGSGKTTLAQGLAIFLSEQGYVVRTMEAPRDLQVPDHITQYTSLEGSMENTADILLLVRPDFIVFDELRKNEHFGIYADMRLAGVGMIGVLHATSVQDALQRFLSRVDFGILPQVLNMIVFMSGGDVTEIYNLEMSMRIPTGLSDDRHIRPVILVKEHESGVVTAEAFKHEGETIVMSARKTEEVSKPIAKAEERISWRVSEKEIQREIGRYSSGPVEVKMLTDNKAVVYIEDRDVPAAIGKGGKNVSAIVSKLGIGIDIRPRSELEQQEPKEEVLELETGIRVRMDRKQLAVIAPEFRSKIVDVFAGKEYLFTATVNEAGEITLSRNSTIAQELIKRTGAGESIRLRPV
ncbi:MAG: PINc/VapC family ATPase [Methanomicrobiales archaeon]|nr:PINc/VapC family ATPase [Methanomicrobiales archaeon]